MSCTLQFWESCLPSSSNLIRSLQVCFFIIIIWACENDLTLLLNMLQQKSEHCQLLQSNVACYRRAAGCISYSCSYLSLSACLTNVLAYKSSITTVDFFFGLWKYTEYKLQELLQNSSSTTAASKGTTCYSEPKELKYTPYNKLCKAKKHVHPFQNTWKAKISEAPPTDWCLFFTGSCLRFLGAFLDQGQHLKFNSLIIFKRQMNCLRFWQPWFWFNPDASSSCWTMLIHKALCPDPCTHLDSAGTCQASTVERTGQANLRGKTGFHLQALKELQGEMAELLRLLCNFLPEASSWCLKDWKVMRNMQRF